MKIKIFGILALILSILLCFSLVSCDDEKESESTKSESQTESITESEDESQSESESQTQAESESESESESEQQSSIPCESISFNKSELVMKIGDIQLISVVRVPSNTTDKYVEWSSTNESVATVSSGKITAKGEGTATICAVTSSGLRAECVVTVESEQSTNEAIKIGADSQEITDSVSIYRVGSTLDLYASVSNSTDKNFTWSVADTSIASVDNNGVVTAKKHGKTTLTVTHSSGVKREIPLVIGGGTPITRIEITHYSSEIVASKTSTFEATSWPYEASMSGFTWSSSDTDIATVEWDITKTTAIVKGISAGEATITVEAPSGVSASVKVTVKAIEDVPVELYVNGQLWKTLYSTNTNNYYITLENPSDILTDPKSTQYFSGWYKTETFTGYLSQRSQFKTPTKIYAKMVDIDVESFTYTVTDGKATITGYTGEITEPFIVPAYIGEIPVVAIADNAFLQKTMQKAIICEGIKEIGSRAFSDCGSLTDITIPSSIEKVGYGAFLLTGLRGYSSGSLYYLGNEENLYLVAFLSSMQYTGSVMVEDTCKVVMADVNNARITEFKVFDGEYLCAENGVLYSKDKTELLLVPMGKTDSFEIPAGVTFISDTAFYKSSIEGVTLNLENKSFVIDGGVLYNADKTEIIAIFPGAQGEITVPATITSVSAYAMSGATNVTKITFLGNIKKIEDNAFGNCAKLQSIVIEGSDTYTSVSGIVYDYEKTGIVVVPKALGGSVTIPSTIKAIPRLAFSSTKIESVIIENGVQSIGSSAFSRCKSLTSVTIPSSVTKIEFSAFEGCEKLTAASIADGLLEIERDAFAECSSLAEITLPSTLTKIGDSAFEGCTSLGSIKLVTGAEYGSNVFRYCSSLKSVSFPDDMTKIPANVFSHCLGIEELVIPSHITEIGDNAFSGCSGIKKLTLSSALTSIGNGAFSGCTGITELPLPAGLVTIGDNAFYGCDGLKALTLPTSVKTVGASAFSRCSSLAQLNLNDGLESLGMGAFSSCNSLISVVIPSTIQQTWTLNSGYPAVFYDCKRLAEVYNLSSANSVTLSLKVARVHTSLDTPSCITTTQDGYRFVENNGEYYLFDFPAGQTELVLPSDCNSSGYHIVKELFKDCAITSVKLPSTLKTIGDSAFQGSKITSIEIPDSVTSIGASAFSGSKLTSVRIGKGVTSMGKSAFASCPINNVYFNAISLQDTKFNYSNEKWFDGTIDRNRPFDITIGKDAKRVPSSMFSRRAVGNVTFEQGSVCEEIGEYAFDMNYISSLSALPSTLKTIGKYAFRGELVVDELVIPDSVIEIGENAFSKATIGKLTIGSGVTLMSASFYGAKVTELTFKDPTGWYLNGGNTTFTEEELTDNETAIKYLTSSDYYENNLWKKS